MNELALLSVIVFVAFLIETATGFGSMVVGVTVGALFFTVDEVLRWLIPVNMALGTYMMTRRWRVLDWRFLVMKLLPLMCVGLVIGRLLAPSLSGNWVKLAFGLFVMGVGLSQLRAGDQSAPLNPAVRTTALLGAGVTHGLFGTGGPLAVYVSIRSLRDKATFRATMSALWLVLNGLLGARLGITTETLTTSAWLLPALALGIVVGEAVHHRLDERRFKLVVAVMLIAVGGVLAAKQLVSSFAA